MSVVENFNLHNNTGEATPLVASPTLITNNDPLTGLYKPPNQSVGSDVLSAGLNRLSTSNAAASNSTTTPNVIDSTAFNNSLPSFKPNYLTNLNSPTPSTNYKDNPEIDPFTGKNKNGLPGSDAINEILMALPVTKAFALTGIPSFAVKSEKNVSINGGGNFDVSPTDTTDDALIYGGTGVTIHGSATLPLLRDAQGNPIKDSSGKQILVTDAVAISSGNVSADSSSKYANLTQIIPQQTVNIPAYSDLTTAELLYKVPTGTPTVTFDASKNPLNNVSDWNSKFPAPGTAGHPTVVRVINGGLNVPSNINLSHYVITVVSGDINFNGSGQNFNDVMLVASNGNINLNNLSSTDLSVFASNSINANGGAVFGGTTLLANGSSNGNIGFNGSTSTTNYSTSHLTVVSQGSITYNGSSNTRGTFLSGKDFTFNGSSTLYGEIGAKGNITFNGSTTVKAISADFAPPTITAALSNDTGTLHTDNITSDPTTSGTIADTGLITSLKAGFDNTSVGSFTNINSQLSSTGSFNLSRTLLAQIYGGTIPDGAHTLHLVATDLSGNSSSLDFTFTLDTTPPSIPSLNLSPSSDSGISNSDRVTNINTPTITGTAQAGALINILSDGISVGSTTASSNGSWTTVTSKLTDGAHLLTATATDIAGNVSLLSTPLSLTIDTQPPTSPSFSLSPSSDSGISNSDRLTNINTPTITGTAQAGAIINILSDGISVGSTTASSNGSWTTVTSKLTDGTHQITATATDIAGNVSLLSTPLSLTIDTQPPTAPSLSLSPSSDSGISNSDRLTNINTPTITGTAQAGALINILSDGISVGSTTASSNGSWTGTTSKLNDGTHQITATATDVAGNVSLLSTPLSLTIDTVNPQITLTNLTNNASLTPGSNLTGTVNGTGSIAATLNYKFDNLSPIPVSTNSTGAFNQALDFTGISAGLHTLTITATDVAGNVTTNSLNITLVTAQPTIKAALANDTAPGGLTNNDGITTDPTITGTITDSNQLTTFLAGFDNTPSGSFTSVLPNLTSGSFTLSNATLKNIYGKSLSDGLHTLHLLAKDAAGNNLTADTTFTLDTAAPTLNIDAPIINSTSSGTARLIGSATDTGAGLAFTTSALDGAAFSTFATDSKGHFDTAISPTSLADGQHSLLIKAVDVAGNQTSTTLNFNIANSNFFIGPTATSGWGATTANSVVLGEGNSSDVQTSLPVTLGEATGSRHLQFDLNASFDTTDSASLSKDRLNVYLVNPANPSQTLLDNGTAGTALFSLSESGAEYTPGLVRYDGKQVDIDLTSLANKTSGQLIFQLLNGDTDTGSIVRVQNISSVVNPIGIASPVFPQKTNLVAAGAALNLASLTSTSTVEVQLHDVRLDPSTGRYTANLQLHNTGTSVIGRQSAVVFSNLPAGVQLLNPSGVDANGVPYINFHDAIVSGGLDINAISAPIQVVFNNPNLLALDLQPVVKVSAPSTPIMYAVGPLSVTPGSKLEVPLSATDANGDAVTFSVKSDKPLPNGEVDANGKLIFSPSPDQVGTYNFTVVASNGLLTSSQPVTLTVTPDPVTTTRISGIIENTSLAPLGGVAIQIGSQLTLTNADGSFQLEFAGALPDNTLKVYGSRIGDYPFIAEKVPLLLGHDPYSGVNNVISRPIYLPPLDTANARTIDPNSNVTVTTTNIPGASVFVAAGTLKDKGGNPFTGQLSITQVPTNLTPAALPSNLHPDLVVTIQPGEMVFTQPAPLSLPNRAGYAPGELMDLWSINPNTGFFDNVGTGQVSADGSEINTISGGIHNSSWHFFVPQTQPAKPLNLDPFNLVLACNSETSANFGTDVKLHSGAVVETDNLVSYQSDGVSRGLTLTYDSLRADPRQIVHFGYDNIITSQIAGPPLVNDLRLVAKMAVNLNGVSQQLPGIAAGQYGLSGGENFWSLPSTVGSVEAAFQVDLSSQLSGQYDYSITSGIDLLTGNQFAGTTTTNSGKLISVNSINSPFGSGWGLSGLQELVKNLDGSVLLIDGNDTQLIFTAPSTPGGAYIAPPGDFSTLVQLTDNTFQRTTKDKTVYHFNANNQLESVTDRNNNATHYIYNASKQLIKIVDPVSLTTTFNYTGTQITSITDPTGRTTLLQHDAAGNLKQITDPDTTYRTWGYDSFHHMTMVKDKLGNQGQDFYDATTGRAMKALRPDLSQVQVAPVEVQGLYATSNTINPNSAPYALGLDTTAFYADGNGNTTSRLLDRAGQTVSATDGAGILPSTQRDAQNLVKTSIDGRGHATNYTYDASGNVLSIFDELSQGTATAYSYDYQVGNNPVAVALGDVNGDGIPDLVTANSNSNTVSVALGNGDGTFFPKVDYAVGNAPGFVAIGDINGDGNPDLVVANAGDDSVTVLKGNGLGSFSVLTTISMPSSPTSIALGDVDGNGTTDIVVASFGLGYGSEGGLSVFESNGNGTFQPRIDYATGTNYKSVALSDLNADGRPDLVAANSTSNNSVSVLLNNGLGTFGTKTDYAVGTNPTSVALGDVNSNGKVDIITTNSGNNTVSVLLGNGDGIFGAKNDYSVGTNPTSVALGDWNGDGFVDLITANSGNNTVSVLLGNGSGSFSSTNSLILAVGNGPTSVALSDFNSDGLLDFVAANSNSNTVTVSINGTTASGGTSGGQFYTYDPVFNEVTSFTDELGRQTLYQIDPNNGNLLSTTRVVSNGSNIVTSNTYNTSGQIATTTDPKGRVTKYDYDTIGNLKQITSAQGTTDQAVQTFEYDAAGNQTASIDENGNRTEFKYDAMNRLYQTTYAKGTPDEAVQKIQYDNSGNQTATIDSNGNLTQYNYDAMNRLSKITAADPDGNGPLTSPVTTYAYDFAGNRMLMTDPLFRSTQYHYDSRNRLIETINPDGGHERQGYDFDNHRTSSSDGVGNKTTYVYDARGRLISQVDPLHKTTRFDYDAANQMIAQVDGNGHRTEFKYDELGRRTTVIDAPNTSATTTQTTQYDANGNIIAQIDGLQHSTTYSYDNRDRKTVVTDALGKSTKTQYDAVGNVLSVTDPDLNTTSYTYDAQNRLKTETNQFGKTRYHSYDTVGNQTSMIDRDGRTRTFTYDALNREIAEKWLDAAGNPIRTISSTYDAASELTDISDSNSTYHYTYDANGGLASVDNAGTPGVPDVVLNYTHDWAGNLLTTTDTISGLLKGTEAYTYDPLNRVTLITQSGNGVTDKRVNIGHNAIGQMTSLSRYSDIMGTQLVAASTYTYDPAERLQQLTHSKGATTLANYTWGYDNANRITSFISPDGPSTYTYDLSNQLTGASNSNESYSYDANGNRTNTGYNTGADNQLQSDGKYTYTYDNEGNRATRTEIATGKVTSYTWDYRNRLTRVVDKNASGNVIDAISYTYDVNDRRISKTVTNGAGATQVERMVYDGDNIALTFDGIGNQTHRYLYGPGVDQVIADENASGQVLWALADNQGTVRDLIDSTGTVQNHIKYDSFGNITSQTNPAVDFRFGYTGREFDKETGQYYYRARYYDTGIGRFLSEDPLGFGGGDVNLYRYVLNHPVNSIDPSGDVKIELVFNPLGRVSLSVRNPFNNWLSKTLIDVSVNHAFIRVTDLNGHRTFYRGGPKYAENAEIKTILGILEPRFNPDFGPIVTDKGDYDSANPKQQSTDYKNPAEQISKVVLDKPCEPAKPYIDGLLYSLGLTDLANIKYKPQTGPNSNSVAYQALKDIGLSPTLPNGVYTPGWGINLRDDSLEKWSMFSPMFR